MNHVVVLLLFLFLVLFLQLVLVLLLDPSQSVAFEEEDENEDKDDSEEALGKTTARMTRLAECGVSLRDRTKGAEKSRRWFVTS